MAEAGNRADVAVSMLGKVKTSFQMAAIALLLAFDPTTNLPMLCIGYATSTAPPYSPSGPWWATCAPPGRAFANKPSRCKNFPARAIFCPAIGRMRPLLRRDSKQLCSGLQLRLVVRLRVAPPNTRSR